MSLPINNTDSYLFIQQDVSGNIQWASNTTSNSSSLTFTTISSWPVQLNKNLASNLNVIILNNLNLTILSQYFIISSNDINIQSDYTNTANITINIDGISNYHGFIQNGSTSVDTSGNIIFNNDAKSNITINYLGVTTSNFSTLDNTISGFEAGWLGQTYWGNSSTGCSITNCYSTGDIATYSGGILGSNSVSIITDCFSSGIIGNYAGGIVGSGSNSTISNCYSSGVIGDYAGGIVGSNSSGSVSNSYSSGTVSITGAGGIIGSSSTTMITNIYVGDGNWSSSIAINGTNLDNTTTPTYSSGNVSNPLGSVWTTTINNNSTPFVLSSFNLNTGYATTSYSSTYGTGSNSTTPSITNQSGFYSIINYTDINNIGITINSGTGVVSWSGTINVNTFNIYVYTATTTTPYFDIVLLNLTINKKALTITALSQSNTYGTSFTLDQTAYTSLGLVNSNTINSATIQYNGSSSISGTLSAGSYALSISNVVVDSGTDLNNYSITYVNGTLTINTKALTITASNQSNTYGTSFILNQIAYTSSGLVNSNTISSVVIQYNGSSSISGTLSAGSYTLTISNVVVGSGIDLNNYSITYQTGTLTINKKALTITALSQSNIYGTSFILDQTAYTSLGLINSDSITSVLIKYNGSSTIVSTLSVGSYILTISNAVAGSGTNLNNYSITYYNGTLTIDKYVVDTLTITALEQSTTYGTTYTIKTTYSQSAFTVSGLLNGDTLTSATIIFTDSTSGISNSSTVPSTLNAGIYLNTLIISTISGTKLNNYTIQNYNYIPGNMVINTKALTITALTQSSTYGTSFTLDQTAYTSLGLVNNDVISLVLIEYNGSNYIPDNIYVGTYSGVLIISTTNGIGLNNYTISYVDGNLTITLRNLTITSLDQSTLFNTTFNLSQKEYTVSGLNSSTSDNITSVLIQYNGSTTVPNNIVSGTYILNISNASGSGLENYNIIYVTGNLYVNIIYLQNGKPNRNNFLITLKCLKSIQLNYKEILSICSITNNENIITDLIINDNQSKIQLLLTNSKNIMDLSIVNYYSSYNLRVGALNSNIVKFNILAKYNIGQDIIRNLVLMEIDLNVFYQANTDGSISVKQNSEIYSNLSNSNIINNITNIIKQINDSIEILNSL